MNVTPDEILDSLTRQAHLRERLSENGNISFEEIAIEDAGRLGQSSELASSFKAARKWRRGRTGRYAFAAMLLGGLAILWWYGILSRTLDPGLLGRIQSLTYQTTFSDPTRVLLIAFIAIVVGLLVRRERKGSDRLPLSAYDRHRGPFQRVAHARENRSPRITPGSPRSRSRSAPPNLKPPALLETHIGHFMLEPNSARLAASFAFPGGNQPDPRIQAQYL